MNLQNQELNAVSLTEVEEYALSLLNEKLNLNLSPDLQRTERGLGSILAEMKKKQWSKKQLHECGVSLASLENACAKIVYGFINYKPRNPFRAFDMSKEDFIF